MEINENSGFATVILVANDNESIENSEHLILSRTLMENGWHTDGPAIVLKNLKPETANYKWHIKFTRPRIAYQGSIMQVLSMDANNNLVLPDTDWTECELIYANTMFTESFDDFQVNLLQNYPNPFFEKTNIAFSVPDTQYVKLEVYNAEGKRVAVLVNRQVKKGQYIVSFNANDLNGGIYLCRLQTNSGVLTKKMVVSEN
jgi:hypothetical protein